jgi:hypothetical protein
MPSLRSEARWLRHANRLRLPPIWIFVVTWLPNSGWRSSWCACQECLWWHTSCRDRAHPYNGYNNGAVGLLEGEETT